MNSASASLGFGSSSNYITEIITGLVATLVLYVVLGSMELLSNYMNRLEANRVELLPDTYSMESRMIQIPQNPNLATAKTAMLSSNESTGIEFSYSFFLKVPQQAFDNTAGLRHIFHKGSPSQFPLLGPGVYMHNNINTLRIYMNTYDTWNNYVEVPNFPIGKWCHVVIVCRSMHLEIYVNGNIASRLGFNIAPPYQNYGDIYAFSNQKPKSPPSTLASLNGDTTFVIQGTCKGQLSRLLYFNYALSYSEINTLMNQGPSSKMDSMDDTKSTTYLTDNWWTADFTQ